MENNIIQASSLYVGMRGIFQDGGRFGTFLMFISLLSYFLQPYNWLSWFPRHWAMLLLPSERSKPLPKSHSIISRKAWFPWFSSFFLSFFLLSSFFIKRSYPCPIRASWVSFLTVLQCLGRGCARTGSKEERRHFLLMNFMVVTAGKW